MNTFWRKRYLSFLCFKNYKALDGRLRTLIKSNRHKNLLFEPLQIIPRSNNILRVNLQLSYLVMFSRRIPVSSRKKRKYSKLIETHSLLLKTRLYHMTYHSMRESFPPGVLNPFLIAAIALLF
jgi:hypothetical protein